MRSGGTPGVKRPRQARETSSGNHADHARVFGVLGVGLDKVDRGAIELGRGERKGCRVGVQAGLEVEPGWGLRRVCDGLALYVCRTVPGFPLALLARPYERAVKSHKGVRKAASMTLLLLVLVLLLRGAQT